MWNSKQILGSFLTCARRLTIAGEDKLLVFCAESLNVGYGHGESLVRFGCLITSYHCRKSLLLRWNCRPIFIRINSCVRRNLRKNTTWMMVIIDDKRIFSNLTWSSLENGIVDVRRGSCFKVHPCSGYTTCVCLRKDRDIFFQNLVCLRRISDPLTI